MAGQTTRAKADVERKIDNAVAGHTVAGFDVTDEHRAMLRKIAAGELSSDQVIAEIQAKNAAK